MADKMQLLSLSKNNFEQCLKCSICTVYCPVSAVTTDYPGPKHAGPDGERYRLKDPKFFDEKALKLCLNCKRCEVACPQGVKVGDIIQSARIKYSHHLPSLRDFTLASTDLVGGVATKMAPIVNYTLGLSLTKSVMHTTIGVDKHRTFPKYTSQTFEDWYNKEAKPIQQNFPRQISYFHGCYVNYNFPQLGKDFVKVMNAIGYGVHLLDKEKCCGVAYIANGMSRKAAKNGEVNMNAMKNSLARGRQILTTSSTCTFTMRNEYEHLLHLDNAVAKSSLWLATCFIYRLVESGKVKLAFRSDYKKRIAYHTACHMEKLGWAIYSTGLLKMIPGLELVMLDSQCCGIGGTYGFKKENYKVSQAIGSSLFKQIKESEVDYVTTDCETCKWQIEMSTGVMVQNPISVIAEALDIEATKALNINNK